MRARWALLLLAALVLVPVAPGPVRTPPAVADEECRIAGGHATLRAREGSDAGVLYEGAMTVILRGCGQGPRNLSGTFSPVGGTPTNCSPNPSTHRDYVVCTVTTSLGLAAAGAPVVVTAMADVGAVVEGGEWIGRGQVPVPDDPEEVAGTRPAPGLDEATSVCVLAVPEVGGRMACTLF